MIFERIKSAGLAHNWGYGSTLHDGEAFRIGSLKITALHTPGHTDESMSYALADLSSGEDAAMVMVFTGDALFVGTLAEPASTVLRSRGN